MNRHLATILARIALGDRIVAGDSSADTAGGWVKHPGNPVLGCQYGTCFDVAVLRENETYRMWVASGEWRNLSSQLLIACCLLPTSRQALQADRQGPHPAPRSLEGDRCGRGGPCVCRQPGFAGRWRRSGRRG